jgi:hypothetical protein
VEEHKKATKEYEIKMRAKASSVGNIVGPKVPVSMTEVILCLYFNVGTAYAGPRMTMRR